MRALSIRQPWAELIISGQKDIENRSRNTLIRERIAVHASKVIDVEACDLFGILPWTLVTGAIVGFVNIDDSFKYGDEDMWADLYPRHLVPGLFQSGVWGWKLSRPERLKKPIYYRGQLGFFEVDLKGLGAA